MTIGDALFVPFGCAGFALILWVITGCPNPFRRRA